MYWTRSPGTGGHIAKEDDFAVDEIPSRKFFVRYTRGSGGVSAVNGPYSLCLLKKRGMTTRNAVDFIKKRLGAEIGYAGLKDKFAVTTQYVTIRGDVDPLRTDRMELAKIGNTDRMMQVGELEGNRFRITLHDCSKPENAASVVSELEERGLPNYFGPQRFGTHGDNHDIGCLILKRDYAGALELIRNQSKKFDTIQEVDRKLLKFFIHAYQSYVFNRLLDVYVTQNKKPFFGEFPIVGFGTKLKRDFAGRETAKILRESGLSEEDFRISGLSMACRGGQRHAFTKVKKISCRVDGSALSLEFELPKGSYATVLIGEIAKAERGYK